MNSQQIKDKILADIALAKGMGYTLISEDWGYDYAKCACPLGCVNVANGTHPQDQDDGGCRQILGVSDKWITSFIDGFDGNGHAEGAMVPEAWQIGQDIRRETKPVNITQFICHGDDKCHD